MTTAKVTREQMAEVLREIATLLELKGENPFKTRAYKNGADVVETHPGDIAALAAAGELKGIKGIGDALQQKLTELAQEGELKYHQDLRAEFPEGLFELFEVQGLGPKKIKALYEGLGVGSIDDLKRVCESGEVSALAGFGAKGVEKILESIAFRESNADRFHQDVAMAKADEILGFLRAHPDASQVAQAGSLRRGKETVGDLDFIVSTKKPAALTEAFGGAPFAARVIAQGDTKCSINLENGLQVDLRAVSNAEFPFALNYFTGSKEHNVMMRGRAQKRGFTLNEYRLAPTDGDTGKNEGKELEAIVDEPSLYRFLGLDYIEPELREGAGEIEAAEEGTLPKLVEAMNLRGTFHNHTTASDGKASLAEMAEGAQELGLEYLGIADHSKASFQANGLDADRLLAQVGEIKALNEGFDGFRLFTGTEVDILRDGSLDFPDEVLGQLDYSVASVHNAFTLSQEDMTARIIRAIENPHVTMLGHMTGRLLLKRDPYALDIPAVIEACADTGTIIELNANAWRLDMDWRWWRMAKEKGVKCAINPDAHSVAGLQSLRFGINIARKGWLERDDVVNCLPLAEMEEMLGC